MYYFKCPRCGNNESFHKVDEETGTRSLWALLSLLLPLILALGTGRPGRRVQCVNCGYVFVRPGVPCSPATKAILWTVFLLAVSVGLAVLVATHHIPYEELPGRKILDIAKRSLETYSMALTVGCAAFTASLAFLLLIVVPIAEYRHHAHFRKLYKCEPPGYPKRADGPSEKSADPEPVPSQGSGAPR